MSDPVPPSEGTWCHVEIPAQDPEKAQKFYGEVFGWKFQHIPEMDYTLYTTREGGIGGGIMKPQEHGPTHMVNYVYVKEIDPVVERVKNNGGSVVFDKMQVGEAGWMAWVKDPEGNVFGLWKSMGP